MKERRGNKQMILRKFWNYIKERKNCMKKNCLNNVLLIFIITVLGMIIFLNEQVTVNASANKVSTKKYAISKDAGAYTNKIKIKIKAKKGYKVYYTLNGTFKAKKVIKSGKKKKIIINQSKILKIYAIKSTNKMNFKKIKKKAKKRAKKYTYIINNNSQNSTPTIDKIHAEGNFNTSSSSDNETENSEENETKLCTVIFETNGGTSIKSQEIVYGGVVKKPGDPIREGYKFTGWYKDYELKQEYDFREKIIKNMVLYAGWEKVNIEKDSNLIGPFVVAFDLNYNGCKDRTEQIVEEGMTVKCPSNPIREGYTFDGWYVEESTKYLYDFNDIVDKSMVLYAEWSPIDTDMDGANDNWEVDHGYDPDYYDAHFSVEKSANDETVTASVNLDVKGNQVDTLMVYPITNSGYFTKNIPGYMGSAFNFEIEGYFDSAEITFTFDPAVLSDTDTAKPTIYYLNEDTQELEEQETVVSGNTASTTVDHFSTYILLNKTDFEKVWNSDIKPPEAIEENSNLDVVFLIDSSGSMTSNDRDNLRLEAARTFVDKLTEKDSAAVIDFDSSAYIYQTFTNDKEKLYAAIDKVDSSGGTDLSDGMEAAIQQFTSDQYNENNSYKIIIMLTDGEGSYNEEYTNLAAENDIVIYTVGLGNGVDEQLLQEIAEGTNGKYYFAIEADALSEIYNAIAGETVDYITDSNNDMISDYFTQKLCEGILTYGSGSPTEFYGIAYEDIQANNDYDGDGIKNGEEIEVYYDEELKHIFVYYHSNPIAKEEVTSWHATDSHFNSSNVEGGNIFNRKTSLWGMGEDIYEYNESELTENHNYTAPGNAKISKKMIIPQNANVTVNGNLDISADVIIGKGASLVCTGDLKIKAHVMLSTNSFVTVNNGELKVDGKDSILDMKEGGKVSCKDFFFDSGTNHTEFLKKGVIEVSQDVEIRENFYATGNHEFHIVSDVRHTINVWNKIIDEELYFNKFRIVGNGIEVLDVKEPFHCYSTDGFVADDWSWLLYDYYGEDFLIASASTSKVNNWEHSLIQTGAMLAIAQHKENFAGSMIWGMNLDEYTFSAYNARTKRIEKYTLNDINITTVDMASGSAITGSVYYQGRLFLISTSPELVELLWKDFKNTAAIEAIKEVGDVYLGAYKNLVKTTITEFLPNNLSDAFEMTTMIKKYGNIMQKYYELGK